MPEDPESKIGSEALHSQLLDALIGGPFGLRNLDKPAGFWIEALRQVFALHRPVPSTSGPLQCEECADQCHSRSGLGCDSPDAEWPCGTVRVIASALGVET